MAARLKSPLVETIAKITPADYPELLAAVDAGATQRELALRYDCAPSLVARHIAKAKRAREANEPARGHDRGVTADTHSGSIREILEARIRDPKLSARDLASLANALVKLDEELDTARDSIEQVFRYPFANNPALRVVRVYVLPTDDTILSSDEWSADEAPPDEDLLRPPSGYELAPRPERNLDGSIEGSKPKPEPEEREDTPGMPDIRSLPYPGDGR
jgi:hypothetical protein